MTVEAKFELKLDVDETLELGQDHVTDPEVTDTLGTDDGTLNALSTPPATKRFSDQISLSTGSGSLDLTSLAGPLSTTVDFTGLKVQLVKLKCPSGNTAAIEVVTAGANGYNLFGLTNATAEKVSIPPGGAAEFFCNDKLEDVDATHKGITLTGTGTESISVQLVAG